ncbi:MAG: hypothetical protein K2G31_04495 [Clostridia bacterium]|nr:hypothetical protein [Clostridia bacterium]
MNEENQKTAILQIAALLMEGVKDEAETNKLYLNNLARIVELSGTAELDEATKAQIEAAYKEIMEDELNHAQKFFALSNQISGLVPNSD